MPLLYFGANFVARRARMLERRKVKWRSSKWTALILVLVGFNVALIGARNEEQLRDNLGAVGWSLSTAQVAHLDAASALVPPYPYYPYWNGQFAERTPAPVAVASAAG